jgi:hypothetical protein
MRSLDFIRLREAPATTITSTTSANVPGNPQSHPNYQKYLQQELAKGNRANTPNGEHIAAQRAATRVQAELAKAKSGEQISVNGSAPVQVGGAAAQEVVPPGFVPASSQPPAQTLTYNATAAQPVAPQPTIQSQPTAPPNQPVPGTAPAPADPNSGGEMTSAAPAGITAASGAAAAPAQTAPTTQARAPVASAPGEGPTGVALAKLGVSKQDRLNQQFVNTHLGPGFKAGSAQANTALLAHFQKAATPPAAAAVAPAPAVQDPRAGTAESITKKQPILEYKNMTAAEKMAHFRNIIMEAPPRGNPQLGSALNTPTSAATPPTGVSTNILGPNGQPITPTNVSHVPVTQTGTGVREIRIDPDGTIHITERGAIHRATATQQAAAVRNESVFRRILTAFKTKPFRTTAKALGYGTGAIGAAGLIAGAIYGGKAVYDWYRLKDVANKMKDVGTMIDAFITSLETLQRNIQTGTAADAQLQSIRQFLNDVKSVTSTQAAWDSYYGENPMIDANTPRPPEQIAALTERIYCLSVYFKEFDLGKMVNGQNINQFDYAKFLNEQVMSKLKSACTPIQSMPLPQSAPAQQ